MAAVRTFTLPHYEAYPVQVALFKDVKNADFLRSQLLAANPEFDYAFLDAAMVSVSLISQSYIHNLTNARLATRSFCRICLSLQILHILHPCVLFRFLPHGRVVFILFLGLVVLGGKP
jgi:EKC/KEOPS complex subunit CGI121/TPRKB